MVKFLDLGSQPLANSFLKPEELNQTEKFYPLEVYFCTDCYLVQLVHVVDKSEMFRHYLYFSSGMPKVSSHWQEYARDVMSRFLAKEDLVVEAGSNDGVLLKFFKGAGFKVMGVDPAENIAKIAEERGVPTMATFFTEAVASDIVKKYGQAKAVLANNVFAHIDDHHGFCAAAKTLLAPQGVLVIEAPYLIDMFENLAYDTVYHEHLSYLAVNPLARLFKKSGLEIFDVKIVAAQGQSLRIFVSHMGAYKVEDTVAKLLLKEDTLGLGSIDAYYVLTKRIELSKNRLLSLLGKLKSQGKKVYGYGAPAKGNTLLNYCGIGPDMVQYALEDMPSKHGMLTPGMHIPVITRAFAEANPPDYYLLMAWNYKKTILEKEGTFMRNGGKF
ncbi:MAG: class I SAM-dependent methyltransferase, partial [bacterium]|nr:class I SAM-dependent methyltransferase [bacterium]